MLVIINLLNLTKGDYIMTSKEKENKRSTLKHELNSSICILQEINRQYEDISPILKKKFNTVIAALTRAKILACSLIDQKDAEPVDGKVVRTVSLQREKDMDHG